MQWIKIISPDPIVEKLLILLAEQLPEQEDNILLLDAAWMDRMKDFPGMRIILFTASCDPGYLRPARESEAKGLWYLQPSVEDLCQVLRGDLPFPEKAPRVKLGSAWSDELTLRELEVLRVMTAGKTDAQISEILNMSIPTVKHHIQQLRLKTGFSNRTQMAVAAVSSGLICKKITIL